MNPPPNREVVIFNAALELPTSQRAAYLQLACADDPALRLHIEDLLRVHEQAGAFMETEAQAAPNEAGAQGATINMTIAPSEKPGDHIGRYKLLQQIGEGGCGVVYMAEQEEPVRRRVALKVIKLGMDTKQVIARFEAERQALALMDHPNIARVFDAGATETGRPYFVMELIKGIPITRYCDENNLSTVTRLGLFVQACQAIQHAHQKGIIHRDIKPSNVLVADHDGVPVPKIIDFGIAKATTDQRLTDKTLFTALEQFIGTPAYMSPEQAKLSGLDIDTRSDIYSLGVMLYELLTGKTPFEAKRLLEASLDELRRIIREEEPVPPSTRLHTLDTVEQTTVAKHRQSDPPKLVHLIRGDLDWIVMKALEKDRGRRYETANGLAMDIQRHLNGEPVLARPQGKVYRFGKLVRRNKAAFAAMSAVAGALFIAVIVSSCEAIRSRRAEREQTRLREAAQNAQAKEAVMRQLADTREISARRNAYASDLIAANLALQDGNFGLARTLLAQHQPEPNQEDLRGFEWRYLWGKSRGEQLKTITGHSNYVNCIAYSPDGTILASGGKDNMVKLWNTKNGQLLTNCAGHAAEVMSVAFSPNGKYFASGGEDRLVQLWDFHTRQIVFTITNHAPYLAFSDTLLAVTTDGDFFGRDGGTVQLWNYATGQVVADLPQSGNRAAFSPDGKILATANWQGLIKLWNLEDREAFRSFPSAGVRCLAFSPDARFLAWSTDSGELALWELTKEQPRFLSGRSGRVFCVAFSPDGQLLATANQSHDISLWDVSHGQILQSLVGHGKEVRAVAFSPDGGTLASGSTDDTLMLWNPSVRTKADTLANVVIPPWEEAGLPVFSSDGGRLAAASVGGGLLLYETANGQASVARNIDGLPVAFSRDGKSLFTRNETFTLFQQWDVSTQMLLASLRVAIPEGRVYDSAFSPDGKIIATSKSHEVALMNASTGELLFSLSQPSDARCLSFSSDSKMLATGHYDGTAKLWDLKTRQVVCAVNGFRMTIGAVAFSANGLFAAGSWDGNIKVFETNVNRELATLSGHKAGVIKLAFSNDERTLASASNDNTMKLWNLATGREVINFKTEVEDGFLRFSLDDKILAAGGHDGVVHFWRAPSWEKIVAAEGSH